jgi:hypothetical protein
MNIIYQQLLKLIKPEEYFLKCEKNYLQCLEKNQFRIDLTSSIQYVSVSIILKHFINKDYYEIDTKIHIVDMNNNLIGSYRYIEDNDGNSVDDYLVGNFDYK